jgi:transcriptional regulator with XRE-family HTH domain
MSIRSPAHAAFGEAIRQIRNEQDLSQEALADACDLDRTYISGIERGTRNPSLTNILKIAAALNTRAADLLARAEALLGTTPGSPPSRPSEPQMAQSRPQVAHATSSPKSLTD